MNMQLDAFEWVGHIKEDLEGGSRLVYEHYSSFKGSIQLKAAIGRAMNRWLYVNISAKPERVMCRMNDGALLVPREEANRHRITFIGDSVTSFLSHEEWERMREALQKREAHTVDFLGTPARMYGLSAEVKAWRKQFFLTFS